MNVLSRLLVSLPSVLIFYGFQSLGASDSVDKLAESVAGGMRIGGAIAAPPLHWSLM